MHLLYCIVFRTSAHSDVGSSHSVLSAPTQHHSKFIFYGKILINIFFVLVVGPPPLHHVVSDTRLITSPYKTHRQPMSPSKAYATEFSQVNE